MKYVLIGDAESPHLLKWARELHPHVDLWVVSSRGFLPAYDSFLPKDRRFAFNVQPGWWGWCRVFARLGVLGRWLSRVDADWLNPHYLTSHGLLVALVSWLFRLRGAIVGSAWGSDVLLAPQKSRLHRYALQWIISQCDVMTSDSQYMAKVMHSLQACEVLVFPFGLDCIPEPRKKNEKLFFTNRWLESIYNPKGVIKIFKKVTEKWPDACLVVANTGSMKNEIVKLVEELGLSRNVDFVGHLDALTQQDFYADARWFISVPSSDALSVSVLEAMANGCFPILSNLPANNELVRNDLNGLIIENNTEDIFDFIPKDVKRLDEISKINRDWVKNNALFGPSINLFLEKLKRKV
jgi:glycosyltransferase involved in cell wall biosynthesis